MRLPTALALTLLAGGCADGPSAAPQPAFPADYTDSYVEVRNCRKSADHELEQVRVLADPDAIGPYRDRAGAFPEGAIVLKEQYDASDTTCSGPIAQWTVMQKNNEASARGEWAFAQGAGEAGSAQRSRGCHPHPPLEQGRALGAVLEPDAGGERAAGQRDRDALSGERGDHRRLVTEAEPTGRGCAGDPAIRHRADAFELGAAPVVGEAFG